MQRKTARMIAVRWSRWPQYPCMVEKKKKKNLQKSTSPEPKWSWGWIFAQIIGDGRSIKVAIMMIVRWRLTFLRQGQVCFPMHVYGPYIFVWKKCWEFQTCCSNFLGSLLWAGQRKIAKKIAVRWPIWPTCPYMVKTFKNLTWTK